MPPVQNSRPESGPFVARWLLAGATMLTLLSACESAAVRRLTGRAADSSAQSAAGRPSTESPTTVSALPTPVDTTVAWSELVGALRRNPDAVRAVMQTHARKVTMVMKDGRRYHTTEPALDAVLTVLREVDPAGQILVATE